jgi:hypothetical protein
MKCQLGGSCLICAASNADGRPLYFPAAFALAMPRACSVAGRGDVPLIHLRFRCSNCGSGLTNFVVTLKR